MDSITKAMRFEPELQTPYTPSLEKKKIQEEMTCSLASDILPKHRGVSSLVRKPRGDDHRATVLNFWFSVFRKNSSFSSIWDYLPGASLQFRVVHKYTSRVLHSQSYDVHTSQDRSTAPFEPSRPHSAHQLGRAESVRIRAGGIRAITDRIPGPVTSWMKPAVHTWFLRYQVLSKVHDRGGLTASVHECGVPATLLHKMNHDVLRPRGQPTTAEAMVLAAG
ncbi:hypothetical protein PGT21_013921 [Puccinia graminis f. sp. tritici]|uniref:Uncharacterized protein n=1 Tax=Puccinia graminis f. sp. tritici TaxID=56615 RepID=A0A5B0PXI6_PUCGR|nr:hypothetical protein PGT21_013921 [Puccinia graminis f. sp. tritici]